MIIPQLLVLGLQGFRLLQAIYKSGKTNDGGKDIIITMASVGVILFILAWGGFFRVFGI